MAAKKKSRKKRKKNPANNNKKKNTGAKNQGGKNVQIPINRLVNAALPSTRKKSNKKSRRKNPGMAIMNRATVMSMGKLGAGAIVGLVFGSRMLDQIQIAGIGKAIIQVIAAAAARRYIPDRDFSNGTQAVLFANAIRETARTFGFTGLGAELSKDDMAAIEKALTVGEALPPAEQDFLGESYTGADNILDQTMGQDVPYEELTL
jgi:hypothetical protein